jgi:hypothetical protein
MENINVEEKIKELKENIKRKSYFIAGMKYGAKCYGSQLPETKDAVDFNEFDKQYKEENNEGI